MPSFDKPVVNFATRASASLFILSGCFLLLLIRLWYLQVVRGEYFRHESENNRRATVYVPAARGLIYDRNGKVLVKNRPSFDIDLFSEETPDPKLSVERLAQLLEIDQSLLLAKMQTQKRRRRFEPKLLLKDVTRDTVAKVATHNYRLPGVAISVNPAREYIYDSLGAHVLGYIREISAQQLESPHFSGARQGDLVGRYGVEYHWDRYLRGERGKREVIINALLVRMAEAGFIAPRSGHNLTLTLDFDVQHAADEALAGKRGAIVALDPNTGEVLALTSAPAFNPQLFTGAVTEEQWRELESGRERPLTNRVTQGLYPPGSTFKIFMAAAGLAEGVITTKTAMSCPGYYYVGSARFKCHKHEGHGVVNLKDAIKKSCDVYFYNVGEMLGIDRIHKYATSFGFGSPTGIELGHEQRGIVPSTTWKREYYKNHKEPDMRKWWPGETPSVAIGQGATTATPLQLARAIAAVVNGGKLLRPYVVKSIHATDGPLRDDGFVPEIMGEVNISSDILKEVRDGMVAVVNEPGGTGSRAKVAEELNVIVAGKTGTSQVASARAGLRGADYEDHAWFVGYAPADAPEIVVAAIVENGGHGGVAAAPLVGQVIQAYIVKRNGGRQELGVG